MVVSGLEDAVGWTSFWEHCKGFRQVLLWPWITGCAVPLPPRRTSRSIRSELNTVMVEVNGGLLLFSTQMEEHQA
jgi:hypothetical protein